MVVPEARDSWRLQSVNLTNGPRDTKVTYEQKGTTIRVLIESKESAEVKWAANFKSGSVEAHLSLEDP